jgi:hypothetical protein
MAMPMRRLVHEARHVGLTLDTGAVKALMQLSQCDAGDDLVRRVLRSVDRGEPSSYGMT